MSFSYPKEGTTARLDVDRIFMDELTKDAGEAIASLQTMANRISEMLSERPASAGTMQLIAATTLLKQEIKETNRYWSKGSIQKNANRVEYLFSSAFSKASIAFRMRADTAPSKVGWRSELKEIEEIFLHYIRQIRKEFPKVE